MLQRSLLPVSLLLWLGLAAPLFAAAPVAFATSTLQSPAEVASERARGLEKTGDLAGARDAWLQAGLAEAPGAKREDCVSRSRALELRLALRREVKDGFARDTTVFGELGVTGANDDALLLDTRSTPWIEVPIDRLQRLAAAVRASAQARTGLVFEALARGSAAEKEQALATLARLLEKKEIAPNDAYAAIARAKGEPIPKSGYTFQGGRWTSVDAAAKVAQDEGLEALGKKLETALPAQRDELVRELAAQGPDGEARLARALEVRWQNAHKLLERGSTLRELANLATQRTELDQKRKAALDLIFDEETYFYPYNPPECPPEKAKLYAGVQQRVDELVTRVRDVWKATKRVQLPATFRGALDELAWSRGAQKARKLEFASPPNVPAWLSGVDTSLDSVDLATFAWDAKERAELARDRAVAALNQRQWTQGGHEGAAAASTDEQRQVLVTNDYRRMLGRCVLAWNAKIQAAAQGHSDYMANTGDFGHDEPDPKRQWPGDRMRLAGYTSGVSENCALSDGAEGAHVGWLHSSGHHRNILTATHREMGVAAAGSYWTQNFGTGTTFLKELDAKAGQ
ncbi:MAG: CAP domain-containing protein [Planctomycetes bacterium]|nr:CAP domain-containing protein [Planctomycetota bacterium]